VRLDAGQQVADLQVGVAVARLLHLAALGEQRIGLVELQHHGLALGGVEQAVEVLLGLAHVLADQAAQVHPVQAPAQGAGDDAGGQGLAGARGPANRATGPPVARPPQRPTTVSRWVIHSRNSCSMARRLAGSTRSSQPAWPGTGLAPGGGVGSAGRPQTRASRAGAARSGW
jgi:hypothetical protein